MGRGAELGGLVGHRQDLAFHPKRVRSPGGLRRGGLPPRGGRPAGPAQGWRVQPEAPAQIQALGARGGVRGGARGPDRAEAGAERESPRRSGEKIGAQAQGRLSDGPAGTSQGGYLRLESRGGAGDANLGAVSTESALTAATPEERANRVSVDGGGGSARSGFREGAEPPGRPRLGREGGGGVSGRKLGEGAGASPGRGLGAGSQPRVPQHPPQG